MGPPIMVRELPFSILRTSSEGRETFGGNR